MELTWRTWRLRRYLNFRNGSPMRHDGGESAKPEAGQAPSGIRAIAEFGLKKSAIVRLVMRATARTPEQPQRTGG